MTDIKSIWDNQKPTGEIIIKTRIDEIKHLRCFAATNHITGQHSFLLEVSLDNKLVPDLKKYRFKGTEIFSIENENTREISIYLLDNGLKDIFTLFIQNILDEIKTSVTETDALTTTLNITSKWKKLFDRIGSPGLALHQQKGLIGELLFINWTLHHGKNPTAILDAWSGAEYGAKDFTFNAVGIEVKLTTAKHPHLSISSENQLDQQNLNALFVLIYSTEEVMENGFSLNSLVGQIRSKLSTQEDLATFNSKLSAIGYSDSDKDFYSKMYSLRNILTFKVTSDFPKITKNQLPTGIYGVSYCIELSGIESFLVTTELLQESILQDAKSDKTIY